MVKRLSVLFLLLCLLVVNASAYNGNTVVYVTKTGECYHRAGCSYLKSKREVSLQAAVECGYRRCSRCSPPRLVVEEAESKTQTGTKSSSALDRLYSIPTQSPKRGTSAPQTAEQNISGPPPREKLQAPSEAAMKWGATTSGAVWADDPVVVALIVCPFIVAGFWGFFGESVVRAARKNREKRFRKRMDDFFSSPASQEYRVRIWREEQEKRSKQNQEPDDFTGLLDSWLEHQREQKRS